MIAEATVLRQIRLKDARASLGLTQKKLATLAGIHYNVISNCENGGRIRLMSAHAILNALNAERAKKRLPPLSIQRLSWTIEGEEKKEPKEPEDD